MKVTVKSAKKQFQPIKIELVIESLEELVDLYARLNAFEKSIIDSKPANFNHIDLVDNMKLFNVLKNELSKLE